MSRVMLCAALLGATACKQVDYGDAFTALDLSTPTTAAERNAPFIALADAAQDELMVSLPTLEDLDLADAIVAAHSSGVEVTVVTDIDEADSAGALVLAEAGVPLQLADGPMSYFEFTLNETVSWTSEQVRMTHAFALADRSELVFASTAGSTTDGPAIVFSGQSEDLNQDLSFEHTQLFGGADATAVTAFDAMAKSVADNRSMYSTQTGDMVELWLGPQERVGKRLIDGVYSARADVIRLMTNDMADESMVAALEAKAADGFDVEVLLGDSFGTLNNALAQRLAGATGITVLQSTSPEPLPTVLFLDYDRAMDGRYHMPRAMIATHEVLSAARLVNDVEAITDQLTDGALYVVSTYGAPSPWLVELGQLYTAVLDAGTREVR